MERAARRREVSGGSSLYLSSMPITKRIFLSTLVCRTWGWRDHHAPSLVPSPGDRWRFLEGAEVGRRARAWLGAGYHLPPTSRERAPAETAAALADAARPLLFEATFAADGCVAKADAIRRSDGGWDVLEVKSGLFKADEKPSKEYVDDLAYTVAVARRAGLPVSRALLVLVNAEYVEGGALPFLVEQDVTSEAMERAELFEGILPEVAEAATGRTMPAPVFTFECRHCEHFADSCVGTGIPDPLFDVPRISLKAFTALHPPHLRVSEIPDGAPLTPLQWKHVEVVRARAPVAVAEELAKLADAPWPRRFLDFEAIASAIPRFLGTAPYQKVPFQYSLHTLDAPGAEVRHEGYLAELGGDWRRDLAERLLTALGGTGAIVVYSNYEAQVLKQLVLWFPELAPRIDGVLARLFDLEKVVRQGYLHPGFRGKSSIKKVLPVLCEGMDYEGLAVAGGEDAMGQFGLMWVGEEPPEEHPRLRKQLEDYCRLDTQAMVDVWLALERVRSA